MRSLMVAAHLGSALLLLGGVSACGNKPDVVYYHTEFPSYSTVSELYDRANLVVRARVAGDAEVRPITISSVDDTTLVYTVYQAQIERVFKGTPDGKIVEIKLMGGNHAGVEYVAESTISLTPGRTYLLFLEAYVDAPASLLNPAQAQYLVDASGKATPMGGNRLQVSEADLDRLSKGE